MKLPAGWNIPQQLRARTSKVAGRQRAMAAGNHIIIVVHKPPRPGHTFREAVYFWRNPDGVWAFSGRGPALKMLQQIVEEYQTTITNLEQRHESMVDSRSHFKILESVSPLLRASRNLYNVLQKARKSIESEESRSELQFVCDIMSEVVRETELLQEEVRYSLDYSIARQSELQVIAANQQARASFRLNVLAAIFLPMATIAAIFGMNLKTGFEKSSPFIFYTILLVSGSIGILMCFMILSIGKKHEKPKE